MNFFVLLAVPLTGLFLLDVWEFYKSMKLALFKYSVAKRHRLTIHIGAKRNHWSLKYITEDQKIWARMSLWVVAITFTILAI